MELTARIHPLSAKSLPPVPIEFHSSIWAEEVWRFAARSSPREDVRIVVELRRRYGAGTTLTGGS